VGFFSAGVSLPRWQENQYAKSYTSFSSRFRFNVKEWDEETGNYYYGARYYDPKVSVWLSVDPMSSERPSLTPYSFVSNNPIMRVDPTGMLDTKFDVLMEDGTTETKEIDGGVDETHTIAESDFNALQELHNNGESETYEKHIGQLGLGTKGYDIALTARGYEGRTDWSYDQKKGNFPASSYKCNKFVQDVLSENDAAPPGAWPPLAGTWGNKHAGIEGWSVITGSPKLGDVVGANYPYTDASGHVVIITGINPRTGTITSMGTVNSHSIGNNGFGENMINNGGNHDGKTYGPIAIRRYTGN